MQKGKKRVTTMILSSLLLFSLAVTWLFYAGTQVHAQGNLMSDITPQDAADVEEVDVDHNAEFVGYTADFSIDLFKNCFSKQRNMLISPVSAMLSLGMTANGADGKTKTEMEALLGGGKLDIDTLNKYYKTFSERLQNVKSGKLVLANSIWYSDANSLSVNRNFLQTNADYFGADAYLRNFQEVGTVDSMNNWVKDSTGGKINQIIEDIQPDTVMYLMNALLFEADWKTPYKTSDCKNLIFHSSVGNQTASFMTSNEQWFYDDNCEGIIKDYQDSRFDFVAILPKQGLALKDYISSLTGENFRALTANIQEESVISRLPKFKYEYETKLVTPLTVMGMTTAFDDKTANFSKMGTNTKGNLFISDIIHKTYIEVDEVGTRAGAAASVQATNNSAIQKQTKSIVFNRPFVYAVIEKETGLPLFIGTVTDLQS